MRRYLVQYFTYVEELDTNKWEIITAPNWTDLMAGIDAPVKAIIDLGYDLDFLNTMNQRYPDAAHAVVN